MDQYQSDPNHIPTRREPCQVDRTAGAPDVWGSPRRCFFPSPQASLEAPELRPPPAAGYPAIQHSRLSSLHNQPQVTLSWWT